MDDRQGSIRFLVKLARGLHMYGTPADRIEGALEVATARLGIPSQFFSLPTVILAAFGEPEQRSTGLIRVEPGSVHLEKLVLLDDVLKDLLQSRATPEAAAARVDAIEAMPARYGSVATLLAHVLLSAGSATIFGGGLCDVALAALLGGLTGAFGLATGTRRGLHRMRAAMTAFLVSFLAVAATTKFAGISWLIVTVSSLIVLLPGLALTMAISELAAQSLVSGTVRLVSALVVLLELTFGVALGRGLAARILVELPHVPAAALPFWSLLPAYAVATLAFVVLFRARPRDVVPIFVTGALGVLGAALGAEYVDRDLGAFVGAFVVGVVSNLYARWRDRPVAVAVTPGILLLVPGSIGFSGAVSLLQRDVVSGVEAAFRMLLVAAALVAGLLFANVAAPARRSF